MSLNDAASFIQIEQVVYDLKADLDGLDKKVDTLRSLVERIIRLEEQSSARDEGIKRAHQRIDTLIKMIWSLFVILAGAIITTFISKHM